MLQDLQFGTDKPLLCSDAGAPGALSTRIGAFLLTSALAFLTSCGYSPLAGDSADAAFTILHGSEAGATSIVTIDTNCTGCDSIGARGSAIEQFSARLPNGGAASVMWSVSGGDEVSGAGTITENGQYIPPSYLTEDSVQVQITASLEANSSIRTTRNVTIIPGFLQPLTPENVALGANGTVNITGYLSEAGGDTSVHYELANSSGQAGAGQGALGETICRRGSEAFTACSVTYYAPPLIAATNVTYVIARIAGSTAKTAMRILLNTNGVSSNPATHQVQLASSLQLGSSGGNNRDYDLAGNQIVDCCSGTLGALLKGSDNKKYLLSNNHVLARSDQARVGDPVIQPGLIDNNCTPSREGAGPAQVALLSGWPALKSRSTNVDAAIAELVSDSVDQSGGILEMGTKQADGTLSAAPPGISSTGGRGEAASLELRVAKSGRTTGQTCANISALDFDVVVDYYLDCAETIPYLTKTFTHQIAISGDGFSDAGDSGSLVLDSTNAEPVGLYFAGGIDMSGVSQAIASPATEVLNELDTKVGNGVSYTFVGTNDHQVSCLNYGDDTVSAAQSRMLGDNEAERAQGAISAARLLVKPASGILGVATGKSSDHPGEGAILVYVDENSRANVPAIVDGIRTVVIPSNAEAVAAGAAPQANGSGSGLSVASLNAAAAIKQQFAAELMKQIPSFFGVGVGRSLDNPNEAALVIFVDRRKVPAQLPQTIGGLRTRYVVMDRLHVTRSYAVPNPSRLHCKPHADVDRMPSFDPLRMIAPLIGRVL